MGFIKCPRCELNYIREEEQYCPVCKREMKGESHNDPFELCSICNENPVMPGKDVCYACYKEMTQQQGSRRDDEMEESDTSEVSLGMEDVSEMDEIELGGMPEDMPEEIGEQISLEEEKSKEAEDDDEDEDDYEERPRRRRSGGKGSPLPAVLAVGAILIFLAAIGYFLWGILSNIVVPEDVLYATPKLVGRIYDDVKNDAVLLNGFTVEVERTVDSENVREGEIISQNPDAGEEVKSGNMNISVVVSGGTSRFVMDDYTNQRASQIEALLRDKGFEVTIETEHSDVAKGYIIRQDPAKDTRLNEGDVVTLVVSEGAEVKTVTMITVVGQPLERAKSMIEELGLIVGASPEVYDDLQPVGYVVNQSVDAGSEVAEKSIVNLQISKGPDPGVTPSPGPDESTPPASEEPTPPPSESPSQPPESPPAVDLVTKQISIELPVDQDVVDVVVTVGGQTQFEEKSLDTTLRRIRPVLKGSGAGVEVCIYFDGVLAETRYEDFVK